MRAYKAAVYAAVITRVTQHTTLRAVPAAAPRADMLPMMLRLRRLIFADFFAVVFARDVTLIAIRHDV